MEYSFEFQLNSCCETVYAEELFFNGRIRALNQDNSFWGSESPQPCRSTRIHRTTKNTTDEDKIFQIHAEIKDSKNSMNLRNSSTEGSKLCCNIDHQVFSPPAKQCNIKKNRKIVVTKDALARYDERKMIGKPEQILETVNGYATNSRRVHCYKAQENRRKTFLPYRSGLLGCSSLFQTVDGCHVVSGMKQKKAPDSVVRMSGS